MCIQAAEQQHLPLSKVGLFRDAARFWDQARGISTRQDPQRQVTFNATIAAVSRGTRWEERTKYDMLQLSSLVTETTSESVAGVSAAGSNHERHGNLVQSWVLVKEVDLNFHNGDLGSVQYGFVIIAT